MALAVVFDRNSAVIQRGRFSGNYSLWKDAEGNLQLVCLSENDGGRVLVKKNLLDAFCELSCSGEKSVAFHNTHSGYREFITLDELERPELFGQDGYSPFYLFGQDERETQLVDYPF